jgi:structure-specific endonuclease subunit SLX1
MIRTPPFSNWPLHVKIFSPDALEHWENATKLIPSMPNGFTFTVELEGVDGNSGRKGSGRGGPIDVQDG